MEPSTLDPAIDPDKKYVVSDTLENFMNDHLATYSGKS